MSWLYSQVLVEEYLEANSLDGQQYARLNGNHTQQAYCAPDKMTKFSRLSRFGMMCKLLMENLGEELLMWYLEDFPVKTFHQQEEELGLMENEAQCGNTWQESFAKFSQDTHLWKTPHCLLKEDCLEYSGTWPRWGMMQNGECWEQPKLAQITKETGFGLLVKWPAPDANCGQRGTQPNWTPKRKSGHSAQYTINQAVQDRWPTPRSCSAMAATITPESAWKENRNPNLETIVGRVQFPIPTCHNSKETAYLSEYNRAMPSLATHAGGKLNPVWVEWLMGWPLGWTDLKPLEMDRSHCAQQQHGEC